MEDISQHCHRCGFPLTRLDKFCGACGARVSRPCPHCSHEVSIDLQYCNYCGQALAPVRQDDPLSPDERFHLLHGRELSLFEARADDLRGQLAKLSRRYQLRRFVEVIFISGLVLGTIFFLLPYLEAKWNLLFADNPARGIVIAFGVAVMLILVTFYFLDMRRQTDHARISDLRTRLSLSRHWLEEVKQRESHARVYRPTTQAASAAPSAARPLPVHSGITDEAE